MKSEELMNLVGRSSVMTVAGIPNVRVEVAYESGMPKIRLMGAGIDASYFPHKKQVTGKGSKKYTDDLIGTATYFIDMLESGLCEVSSEAEELNENAEVDTGVIDRFFADWEAENVQWYWWIHRQYMDDYKKYINDVRPKIGKTNHLIISQRQMLPRRGYGKSIQEIVSEDIEIKKARLMNKIAGKVGEVTEMNLYSGADGTPNGTVTGTKGTVRITTVLAGGHNIQCLHYRVLVG